MERTRFETLIKLFATSRVTRSNSLRGLTASAAAIAGVALIPEQSTVGRLGDEPKKKLCM